MDERIFKATTGNLVLTETGVTISRGLKGTVTQGTIRGDKFIPYSSIVAVQYKAAGWTNGYLQLSIKGGPEDKGGNREAFTDENTVYWLTKRTNQQFEEARDAIISRIAA